MHASVTLTSFSLTLQMFSLQGRQGFHAWIQFGGFHIVPCPVYNIYRERERGYNKVQAFLFIFETFYSEFSPLRALSRPGWLTDSYKTFCSNQSSQPGLDKALKGENSLVENQQTREIFSARKTPHEHINKDLSRLR